MLSTLGSKERGLKYDKIFGSFELFSVNIDLGTFALGQNAFYNY